MRITTHLMFAGKAEEAMNFYISLFPNSQVISIERYGAGEGGTLGSVKQAAFELNGTRYLCINSAVEQPFTFTPAISLFVDFDTQSQLEHTFAQLSTDGQVFMPPDSYGFSTRFAWVQDKYGVSWQLNLP